MIGSRVTLTIRSTRPETLGQRIALPGVVVSNPFPSSYTSRSGATVPQQRAQIVTLRTSADGRLYARLSEESLAFLAPRGQLVKGLDVTDDGELLSVPAIRALATASLQAYLAQQAQAMPAIAEQALALAGETLEPAPLA
jgi:hypothetical protein